MPKQKSFLTIKRIILTVAVLMALACLACIGFLAIRHHKKLKHFNDAIQAYEKGDYTSAKTLFARCLQDQYNSEEVNKRLAMIAEHEKNWPLAVIYWQTTASLNPFKSDEYMPRQLNALKMSRQFSAIIDTLSFMETKGSLTEELPVLLAYSYLKTGRVDQASDTFAKITDETILKSSLAQITAFSLDEKKHTAQEALDFFQKFHDDKDPFVAFEALFSSANLYAFINDLKNGKECMTRAVAVNPIIGKPLQADYLYVSGSISEAIPVLEECTDVKMPPLLLAGMLGECYTITNQPDKLKKLAEKCKTGSKERIITGYYLESLHAYLTHDDKKLIENIALCEDNFISPLAMLVRLQAATRSGNVENTQRLLKQIMGDRHYANFRAVAGQMGMQFVTELVTNKQTSQAAAIAQQLFDRSKPDLLLARLIVGSKINNGSLTQIDIDYFEKTFPNDYVILFLIARNYLRKGNFQAALETIRTNLDTHANSQFNLLPVKLQLITAQEGLKQFDDGKATALDLLNEAKTDVRANLLFLDYCFNHGYKEELKSYPDKVQDMESDDYKAMKKLALAQLAYLEKQKDQIPSLLSDIGNPQPAILFKIAILLQMSSHFEESNGVYQKILDTGKGDPSPAIYLNLSENCHQLKQQEKALEYVQLACKKDPDSPITNEIYGIRLFEAGHNQLAFQVLDGLFSKKTITEEGAKVWYQLMLQYRIKELYDQKKWSECMEEAKRVLILVPKDESAQKVYDAAEKELKAEEAQKAATEKEQDDKMDAAIQNIQKEKEQREHPQP